MLQKTLDFGGKVGHYNHCEGFEAFKALGGSSFYQIEGAGSHAHDVGEPAGEARGDDPLEGHRQAAGLLVHEAGKPPPR